MSIGNDKKFCHSLRLFYKISQVILECPIDEERRKMLVGHKYNLQTILVVETVDGSYVGFYVVIRPIVLIDYIAVGGVFNK